MVLLDRSAVRTIPLDVYFSFKIHFKLKFFQNVRVRFSPGFPLGGGFPTEQNTHEVLCVNRIPPEQKPDSFLSGKFPSLRKSEYRRSNSLWNTLLQRALKLCRSNLSSPPVVSYHHAGLEQIALREIILLEEIQGLSAPRRTPLKKNFLKMSSGIVRTLDLSNYTICSLSQSRETFPLKYVFMQQ
jgi:hypothetical protein